MLPQPTHQMNVSRNAMNTNTDKSICPHCGKKMKKWVPSFESSWGPHFHWVCFNDDCPYFVNGWKWMEEKFNRKVSYRHRYDPETGESGPLPVWSEMALRGGILEEEDE